MLGGANEYKTVASDGIGVSLGNFALNLAMRSQILINCDICEIPCLLSSAAVYSSIHFSNSPKKLLNVSQEHPLLRWRKFKTRSGSLGSVATLTHASISVHVVSDEQSPKY